MSANTEEFVVRLQLELSEKLDALKAQGLDEGDVETETKKAFTRLWGQGPSRNSGECSELHRKFKQFHIKLWNNNHLC